MGLQKSEVVKMYKNETKSHFLYILTISVLRVSKHQRVSDDILLTAPGLLSDKYFYFVTMLEYKKMKEINHLPIHQIIYSRINVSFINLYRLNISKNIDNKNFIVCSKRAIKIVTHFDSLTQWCLYQIVALFLCFFKTFIFFIQHVQYL